jgi:Lrp/AsnC family transcriptional regulator for asnA, asnC and gidA
MLESGTLQIISLVNPTALDNHQAAYIGFKVQPHKSTQALEAISGLKGVVVASSVSGRFDVIAVVMFNEEHSYQKFLDEELRQVEGLLSTETFFAIGGATFQLRYVL